MNSSKRSTPARAVGLVVIGMVAGAGAVIGFSSLSDQEQVLDKANALESDGLTNRAPKDPQSQGDSNSSDLLVENNNSDLKGLSRLAGDFAGTVAFHNLLLNAREENLQSFLEQSQKIDSPHRRSTAEQSIFQRWGALNPKRALSQVSLLPNHRQDAMVATVFGEWSIADLDGAVIHAKSLENQYRFAALQGILRTRDDLSGDFQRQIAKQLGNEQYALDLNDKLIEAEPSQSPEQSWQQLVNDDRDNVSQLATLIEIADSLVEQQGIQAIALINESLSDRNVRSAIVRSALHRIARSDPQETFHQAMMLPRDLRETALRTIVEAWAQSDPMGAMDRIGSLKANSMQRTLQERALRAWANRDPQSLFENLERLPKNLQSSAEQEAMLGVARSSPAEAVKYLSDLTDSKRKSELAIAIASSWARKDVYLALDWALSIELTDDAQHRNVLSRVLREVVQIDPDFAMETAMNLPLYNSRYGLESVVIVDLAQVDLERAVALLSKVREGRTKTSAYSSVGKALVENGEFDRALRLNGQLPESSRSSYLSSIFGHWAQLDPHSLFESLDRMSNAGSKALAALQLVVHNSRARVLDANQLDHLTSLFGDSIPVHGNFEFSVDASAQSAMKLDVVRMTLEQSMAELQLKEALKSNSE